MSSATSIWTQADLDQRFSGLQTALGTQFAIGLKTTQAELEADLEVRFGRFTQSMRMRPFARDWTTDATADASTYTVIRSGKVPAGLVWDVRRGSITGGGTTGDAFTAVTNALALLVKSTLMPKTTSALEPQFQLVNAAGPVPNDYSFGRGTLVLKNGEELSIVVKDAPNGLLLSASWGVEVYPEEAFVEP